MSTVKITRFDWEGVERALTDYVGRLTARHAEIEEIVLFGSLVTGTLVPGSDVDLLVILTRSDRSFLERIPAFLPAGLPVDVDVFPYTREEIERMKADRNPFIRRALQEGRALFRRA